MSSYSMRDQKNDHLLTPENAALIIIDYQPVQVNTVHSTSRKSMVENMITLAKLAMAFKMPVVLSTVNAKTGINTETIAMVKEVLPGVAFL